MNRLSARLTQELYQTLAYRELSSPFRLVTLDVHPVKQTILDARG